LLFVPRRLVGFAGRRRRTRLTRQTSNRTPRNGCSTICAIESGDLPIGVKLPPETALAER
jgi:DNA-binding FadR family transcriptional regulator